MKKVLFIFTSLFIISIFVGAGCSSNNTDEEYPLEGSWRTNGAVHNQDDYESMDVFLNFSGHSNGNLTYVFPNGTEDVLTFEYLDKDNNIVITSSEGKPLDKDLHIYPYKITGETLTIEAFHQDFKYTRVK